MEVVPLRVGLSIRVAVIRRPTDCPLGLGACCSEGPDESRRSLRGLAAEPLRRKARTGDPNGAELEPDRGLVGRFPASSCGSRQRRAVGG